ncbi:MAG: hypothetical protein LBJ16_01040 [Holosporaceae bacterium]|jgi:hypothetical protein|nr:hypothetical protein [Holosporaceae bacterium]
MEKSAARFKKALPYQGRRSRVLERLEVQTRFCVHDATGCAGAEFLQQTFYSKFYNVNWYPGIVRERREGKTATGSVLFGHCLFLISAVVILLLLQVTNDDGDRE